MTAALFPDTGREAQLFQRCRNAPMDARISAEDLGAGGAYAASLAWSGLCASGRRPVALAQARHLAMEAADSFIEHTARDRPVDPSDTQAAKRLAETAVGDALERDYGNDQA
ncbi:DUF3759 domain-containing protein [Yinghuangia soli]|uniref:DUF3759 domain-containing protein n=1 Tax=Yinghuangia soli TaxID=2908204 RepID=A0AA41U2S0_9ACTN|nr:DUF3759 domain-containing protein [Yinghuangia soli]MCF2530985.1 DUF3759 domain-containing protein [Yinghuangia soli]